MHKPRIITGKYKGLTLKVADSARPVTDRVKKTIFDILGEQIQNKKVLDLFAGSGNLGIEALSQGAESATFIEKDQSAVSFIKENLQKISEPVEVINQNYRIFLKHTSELFNIIFIDPPFAKIEELDWKLILKVIHPKGIIVFKSNQDFIDLINLNLKVLDKRKIGINYIYFLCLNNA